MGYLNIEEKRKYQREWMKKRREAWILENGPCVDCNSWENLEVDHDDPSTKIMNPSQIWSLSESKRQAELAKCKVRCHSCHQIQTLLTLVKDLPPHGTRKRYNSITGPCRCADCKSAHAAYRRERRSVGKDLV